MCVEDVVVEVPVVALPRFWSVAVVAIVSPTLVGPGLRRGVRVLVEAALEVLHPLREVRHLPQKRRNCGRNCRHDDGLELGEIGVEHIGELFHDGAKLRERHQ